MRWTVVWRAATREPATVAGAGVLLALVLLAWLGPPLSPWDTGDHDYTAFLAPPSAEHWWGTDHSGRDVFTLTLVGLRHSLAVGLVVAVLSTGMAAVVGAVAGYAAGNLDRALMWLTDLLLILPGFLVLAVLHPLLRDAGWPSYLLLLAAFLWMVTAKMVRARTAQLAESDFVRAARYMGVAPWRILTTHILPNLSSLLIVDATISVNAAVMVETSLSYFSLGPRTPEVSLGALLATGSRYAVTHPWAFAFSATLLVALVLAVTLAGDGLRRALDPDARTRVPGGLAP